MPGALLRVRPSFAQVAHMAAPGVSAAQLAGANDFENLVQTKFAELQRCLLAEYKRCFRALLAVEATPRECFTDQTDVARFSESSSDSGREVARLLQEDAQLDKARADDARLALDKDSCCVVTLSDSEDTSFAQDRKPSEAKRALSLAAAVPVGSGGPGGPRPQQPQSQPQTLQQNLEQAKSPSLPPSEADTEETQITHRRSIKSGLKSRQRASTLRMMNRSVTMGTVQEGHQSASQSVDDKATLISVLPAPSRTNGEEGDKVGVLARQGAAGGTRTTRKHSLVAFSDDSRGGTVVKSASIRGERKLSLLGIGSKRPSLSSGGSFLPVDDRHRFEVHEEWNRSGLRRPSNFLMRGATAASGGAGATRGGPQASPSKFWGDEIEGVQKKQCWIMIFPSSMPRLCWDVCGIVMVGYDCLSIPLMVFSFPDTMFSLSLLWLTRIFWTLNICISFCTGYLREDGGIEMSPYRVARHYSVTWLPVDMLVVGVDWFEVLFSEVISGVSRLGNAFRLLRIVRLVRVLRLVKMPELMEHVHNVVRSESLLLVAALFKIIIFILVINHVIACAWYGVGLISASDENRWLVVEGMDMKGASERYLVCFHWSISQFAGELTIWPNNENELIFTVSVLFLAILGSAGFIGQLTTTMTQLQMMTTQQASQLSVLRRYLSDQNVPRPLAARVHQNAQHALQLQKKNVSEENVELFKHISTPLMIEVHFEIRSELLLEHPFFECYNDVNPGGIRMACHSAVSFMDMHAGDVLFTSFEVPSIRRMFFIVDGKFKYITLDIAEEGQRGHWMCEGEIWTAWTHCGTMRAVGNTRLLVLDAGELSNIVGNFPTEHVRQYANAFVESLNAAGQEAMRDLNTLENDLITIIDNVFYEDTSSSDDEFFGEDSEEHVLQASCASEEAEQILGGAEAQKSTWVKKTMNWLSPSEKQKMEQDKKQAGHHHNHHHQHVRPHGEPGKLHDKPPTKSPKTSNCMKSPKTSSVSISSRRPSISSITGSTGNKHSTPLTAETTRMGRRRSSGTGQQEVTIVQKIQESVGSFGRRLSNSSVRSGHHSSQSEQSECDSITVRPFGRQGSSASQDLCQDL